MNIEESPFQFLDNTPKIRVIIRKRPLGKKELQKNDIDIIDVKNSQTIAVRETKSKVDLTKYIEEHMFNFDRAFDETASNQEIYLETVRPLVESAFNGAKVTCFAYGQTGSGKTFTMMGETAQNKEDAYNSVPGLYLLAAQDVFTLLEQPCFQHLAVYISFYEIYCTKLHDLLNDRQQLFAREDAKQKVNIVGLSEKRVVNTHSLMQIIDYGHSVRTTSSTHANDDSSRSHAILQITLKHGNKVHGKMSFIDLAGSERGADVVETNKQTRMDGAEINKSLLALKECIRALDLDKRHTPFRGSKLTLVLKDSFTGNCKTVMIGNISPASSACEHTLNTLRYADRVKELKKPTNENAAPLSQGDLLAQQLMLPRQNKNTVKMSLPMKDDDNQNSLQPFGLNNYLSQNSNTNPNSKGSKNRHSMPIFGNNFQNQYGMNFPQQQFQQQQQQQQQQNNYNQNQFGFNNFPPQMYNQPANENLFHIEEDYPQQYTQQQDNSLRDISKGLNNNFSNNSNTNYQQNLFPNLKNQGRVEVKQPYNFAAQINLSKKKAEQEFEEPRQNIFGHPQPEKPVPHVNPNSGNSMLIENSGKTAEESLHEITKQHEDLINVILTEEEEVISLHRKHLDDIVDLIKEEMRILSDVDKPASDIDDYVGSLDKILDQKLSMTQMLKGKLTNFRKHLAEEAELSRRFHTQKNEMMQIYDLDEANAGDDDQLLTNIQHGFQ